MPTLEKNYSLTITPEQFLNACSDNEVRETHLLLQSNRFDSAFPEAADALLVIEPESDQSDDIYKELIKVFGDQPIEAVKILGEIKNKTGLSFLQLMKLMREFQKLEALRIKALVRKPQEQIEEKSN